MSAPMNSPRDRQPPKDWWLENACRIAAFRLRQHKYISANTVPIREQVRDSVEFVRIVWKESSGTCKTTNHDDESRPRTPALESLIA